MEVIGSDGVHVGTVDGVEGNRIKLTKGDTAPGRQSGNHHYIPAGLVANIEGNKVRLSATGANSFMFQEEKPNLREATPKAEFTGRAGPAPRHDIDQPSKAANWSKVGLAAAAVGAAAGAVMFSRRNRGSQDDFELRLQTDENVRLIASDKVEGTEVVGTNGDHLGTIKSFMVDKYTGRVAYAVLSFGGTFGMGTSLFPLPWAALEYDVEKDGYVLDITKEQLAKAPKFEASNAPEFDASYRTRVFQFYRA